jgi:excisionase family DNA binding protein
VTIEQHYRTKEVAELLSVCDATVRRLIQRGELRAVRIGAELRCPESAIRDLLEKNAERGTGRHLERS